MKHCTRCHQPKPLTDFYREPRARDGRASACIECAKKAAHTAKELRRPKLHRWIRAYLRAHPCVDCGETDIVVLEFDHVHGKEQSLYLLIQNVHSLERIKRELARCEVVCVNCHRVRTARQQNWWKWRLSQLTVTITAATDEDEESSARAA